MLKSNAFVLSLLLLLMELPLTGQTHSGAFEHYKQLNEAETRLSEYKDSDDLLLLKLEQINHINKSRKRHRAQPVKLDILASRVANKIATEAALNNYMGHWNLNGEKPYIRYALAGGVDHVTENASSISFSQILKPTDENKTRFMQEAHDTFMRERTPNDGHKKNCIHPAHNYAGIGVAWHNKEFRYYELFIDRYLEIKPFEKTQNTNTRITLEIKPTLSKLFIYAAVVYYEPFPKSMTPRKINRLTQYEDFTNTTHHSIAPWEFSPKDKNGFQSFSFTPDRKGYYYCQIYLSPHQYKKGKASTKGKLPASGIVIRVD
ncbi:CAP domain-containing protein [Marinilabiliaceae bacterium JC017]|nr:CAP domain-containing protein [Marinilabiliaceae bacterium JC017]